MKLLLAALIITSSLFFTKPAVADSERNVHAIVVYDISKSMHMSHQPSWASVGGDFFHDYFKQYLVRCQLLTIDFVAFGTDALAPITVVLNSPDSSTDFSRLVYALAHIDLEGTQPRSGMLVANSLVTSGYDRTVIIFVTDADVVGGSNAELWHLVLPTTEFIAISLGSDTSWSYVERHIKPVHGQHLHANTAPELRKMLWNVFDDFGYDRCVIG